MMNDAKPNAAEKQPGGRPAPDVKPAPKPESAAVPAPPAEKAAPSQAEQTAAPEAQATSVAKRTEIKFALVIDDEPANRDFLMRLLEQAKLDVKGASTAKEAHDVAAAASRLDLIVVDNKLPDGDGVDLMVELYAKHPEAHMVMATMLDERSLMDKAFANGCDVFLVKPHGFMELFRRIQLSQTLGAEDALSRMIIDQYGPRPYRG